MFQKVIRDYHGEMQYGLTRDDREHDSLIYWPTREARDEAATRAVDDWPFDRYQYSRDGGWEIPWQPDPGEPPEVQALREALRQAEEQVVQARAESNRWREQAQAEIHDASDERLRPIWEQAAQAASDEGFCPEYDRLCAQLGIPGRPRLYRGVVNVRFNVYAYEMATDPDIAQETMEENMRERIEAWREDIVGNSYEHESGDITHFDVDSIDSESVDVYD